MPYGVYQNSDNSFYERAVARQSLWIIIGCCVNHLREAFTGQRSMGTWVIEVTEFNFKVSFDLQGHLEAAMASEAPNTAVRGNMHMDTRVTIQ